MMEEETRMCRALGSRSAASAGRRAVYCSSRWCRTYMCMYNVKAVGSGLAVLKALAVSVSHCRATDNPNPNRAQDTRANRTRNTSSRSTKAHTHTKQQHTNAHQTDRQTGSGSVAAGDLRLHVRLLVLPLAER